MSRMTVRMSNGQRVSRPVSVVVALFHLGAVAALFMFSWHVFAAAVALYWLATGIGISMGYHRLLTLKAWLCGVINVCRECLVVSKLPALSLLALSMLQNSSAKRTTEFSSRGTRPFRESGGSGGTFECENFRKQQLTHGVLNETLVYLRSLFQSLQEPP